jgi:hypothetical protein
MEDYFGNGAQRQVVVRIVEALGSCPPISARKVRRARFLPKGVADLRVCARAGSDAVAELAGV